MRHEADNHDKDDTNCSSTSSIKRSRSVDDDDDDGDDHDHDEDHDDDSNVPLYVPSQTFWLNGRLVDRPSSFHHATSYGVLFYRRRRFRQGGEERYEFRYLLGLIPQRNWWTVFKGLPKSDDNEDKNEKQETPYETAAREFEEETSLKFPYDHGCRSDCPAENVDHSKKQKRQQNPNDDRRRASDCSNEIWPPQETTSRSAATSFPFLSTVLHGVTSQKKLLEIYLLPDPDEVITRTGGRNDDGSHKNPLNDNPSPIDRPSLDISQFDVDKVVKINSGYMKNRPEIVELAWLTKRQVVDDGVMPTSSSSISAQQRTTTRTTPVKIYRSQVPIIVRAEELLQRHYGSTTS